LALRATPAAPVIPALPPSPPQVAILWNDVRVSVDTSCQSPRRPPVFLVHQFILAATFGTNVLLHQSAAWDSCWILPVWQPPAPLEGYTTIPGFDVVEQPAFGALLQPALGRRSLTFRSSRHVYARLSPVLPLRVAMRLNSNVRPRSPKQRNPIPFFFITLSARRQVALFPPANSHPVRPRR